MPDLSAQIGPYRIVDTLGEGGLGVVYLAEQSEPVRRQVALKILKGDANSADVLARFEVERQALAVMDHPSIAKVFDAGVTDDGRPYFVMELVSGSQLANFCDERRLTVRERVQLFVDVCHAVQHAHQKGVIHRDLKPSNILVTDVEGRALPRVIDFGIAKATKAAEFDGTQLTRDDQVIGTPAYMSPEQIDGSGDVDTRSDIYALGVLLFEILLGALPYDRAAYQGWAAVAAQMHREPPTPAKRFAELDDTQQTIATLRSTTPPLLKRELVGDLGWIVSRAMEKERDRRYETVNAMALDLQRFLKHEPVRARGASTAYTVRKFVRRNRLGVAFGATVALGLVGFSIVTAVQADRIARARDEAEARRGQAEGLIDFMLSDLRDKLEPIGRLEILDDVGTQATEYFSAIPEDQFTDDELSSRSQALWQIGKVRLDQGDSESAVTAFAESLRLARALSERAPLDAERLFDLSQSHFYVGYAAWLKGDLESAEAEFLGYLAAAERLIELEPDNLDYRLEVGFAHGNLGSVREARGDLTGAAEAYALTLAAKQDLVDRDSTNVDWMGELAETHNKLGLINRKQEDFAGALEQYSRELELKRRILVLAPDHAYWRYRSTVALGFLADLAGATGQLEDGLRLRGEQSAVLDSLVAFDPSNTRWRRGQAMSGLASAWFLNRLRRYTEAESELDRAEQTLTELVRADSTAFGWHADLAALHIRRAELRLFEARPAESLQAADRATALVDDEASPSAARAKVIAATHLARGYALDALGRRPEAEAAWARSMESVAPFTQGVDRAEFRPLLAEILLLLGRTEEAAAELEVLRMSGFRDARLQALAERSAAVG